MICNSRWSNAFRNPYICLLTDILIDLFWCSLTKTDQVSDARYFIKQTVLVNLLVPFSHKDKLRNIKKWQSFGKTSRKGHRSVDNYIDWITFFNHCAYTNLEIRYRAADLITSRPDLTKYLAKTQTRTSTLFWRSKINWLP